MREELIIMYREVLNESEKYKNIYAGRIHEDVAEFQRMFMIYVHENHLSRIDVEHFFEEIVNEAAPVGSELRKNIDSRISYHNLFGNK